MAQIICPYCMAPALEGEPCPSCGRNHWEYVSQPHHIPAGRVLIDRYRIGAVLGEGGFGITYLANDLQQGIRVAIKEYFPRDKARRSSIDSLLIAGHSGPGEAHFQEGRLKFLEEARLLKKLSDVPQIINVRDSFEMNNTAYIVTEYVEGITLTQWVRSRGGKVPAPEVLELMEGVFDGLSRIHGLGLIHRDISPDNMMLENGKIRLLDFGIAREVGRRTETLTMTLRHGYAPVEQYQPMGQGTWTDVYGLSATIYFCITGVKPPHALERICEDTLVLPHHLDAELTHKQEQVLLYGLGVRPRRRFQTVEAMKKELYSL